MAANGMITSKFSQVTVSSRRFRYLLTRVIAPDAWRPLKFSGKSDLEIRLAAFDFRKRCFRECHWRTISCQQANAVDIRFCCEAHDLFKL